MLYVCTYVCVCMYVCRHACMYVCACACVYVVVCIYMHVYTYVYAYLCIVCDSWCQCLCVLGGVINARVCWCVYVCVCVCLYVYIYVHFIAVSVVCTLEQVFWALVHGQVCMIHRCFFGHQHTHLRTHSLQVAHMCVYTYICVACNSSNLLRCQAKVRRAPWLLINPTRGKLMWNECLYTAPADLEAVVTTTCSRGEGFTASSGHWHLASWHIVAIVIASLLSDGEPSVWNWLGE